MCFDFKGKNDNYSNSNSTYKAYEAVKWFFKSKLLMHIFYMHNEWENGVIQGKSREM